MHICTYNVRLSNCTYRHIAIAKHQQTNPTKTDPDRRSQVPRIPRIPSPIKINATHLPQFMWHQLPSCQHRLDKFTNCAVVSQTWLLGKNVVATRFSEPDFLILVWDAVSMAYHGIMFSSWSFPCQNWVEGKIAASTQLSSHQKRDVWTWSMLDLNVMVYHQSVFQKLQNIPIQGGTFFFDNSSLEKSYIPSIPQTRYSYQSI